MNKQELAMIASVSNAGTEAASQLWNAGQYAVKKAYSGQDRGEFATALLGAVITAFRSPLQSWFKRMGLNVDRAANTCTGAINPKGQAKAYRDMERVAVVAIVDAHTSNKKAKPKGPDLSKSANERASKKLTNLLKATDKTDPAAAEKIRARLNGGANPLAEMNPTAEELEQLMVVLKVMRESEGDCVVQIAA